MKISLFRSCHYNYTEIKKLTLQDSLNGHGTKFIPLRIKHVLYPWKSLKRVLVLLRQRGTLQVEHIHWVLLRWPFVLQNAHLLKEVLSGWCKEPDRRVLSTCGLFFFFCTQLLFIFAFGCKSVRWQRLEMRSSLNSLRGKLYPVYLAVFNITSCFEFFEIFDTASEHHVKRTLGTAFFIVFKYVVNDRILVRWNLCQRGANIAFTYDFTRHDSAKKKKYLIPNAQWYDSYTTNFETSQIKGIPVFLAKNISIE